MDDRSDWLDRWLREDARREIAEEGFTERVLCRLPPAPAAVPMAWVRPALIVGSTALGGALAALLSPVGPMVIDGLLQLGHFRGFTTEASAALAMAAILAVAGYILLED